MGRKRNGGVIYGQGPGDRSILVAATHGGALIDPSDNHRGSPATERETEERHAQMNPSILTTCNLPQLADTLVDSCNYDTLFEFISMIDNGIADWDFTKRLAKHFAQVVKDSK